MTTDDLACNAALDRGHSVPNRPATRIPGSGAFRMPEPGKGIGMVTRPWVGNLIGLVVAVLLATLVAPLAPGQAAPIITAICWVAAAVFVILLLISLIRPPHA